MENKELIQSVKDVKDAINLYGEGVEAKLGNIDYQTTDLESKLDEIITLLKEIEEKL
ncbi:hypothetical protein [Macrococcoides caseolyticum]|uniref:hypothetical protein n=1 Tax=Macrococcoides caseolyticum TaxID=69966 RepID=UPI0012FF2558|nr:hypothetical protein [Macrococcus caseolyticus]